MKPLAIFHAVQVANSIALYFSLFSDFPRNVDGAGTEDDDQLPAPFKLGPYLFGKNRTSILTFGRVELQVTRFRDSLDLEKRAAGGITTPCSSLMSGERDFPAPLSRESGMSSRDVVLSARAGSSAVGSMVRNRRQSDLTQDEISTTSCTPRTKPIAWSFEITNGSECITLNAATPFVLFSVLDNAFEKLAASKRSRLKQIAELAMMAGDCMVKINPALSWITETDIRHHILYEFSSGFWKATTTEIITFLGPIQQALDKMLCHDPAGRGERGVFDDVLTRSQVNFAILAKCALFLYNRGAVSPDGVAKDLAVVCHPQLRFKETVDVAKDHLYGRLRYNTSDEFANQNWGDDSNESPGVPRTDTSLFAPSARGDSESHNPDESFSQATSSEDDVSMSDDFAVGAGNFQSRWDPIARKSFQFVLDRKISMFSPYSEATTISGTSKPKVEEEARKFFLDSDSPATEHGAEDKDLCLT